MKKAILVLAMLSAGIPALAGAAGAHVPGTVVVDVNNVFGSTWSYMSGSFNVRYNAAALDGSRISAYGGTGQAVYFMGYGGGRFAGSPGSNFSCYVPTTSSIYSEALSIKNNIGDGTFLYVLRNPTTNECTSVHATKLSDYQH